MNRWSVARLLRSLVILIFISAIATAAYAFTANITVPDSHAGMTTVALRTRGPQPRTTACTSPPDDTQQQGQALPDLSSQQRGLAVCSSAAEPGGTPAPEATLVVTPTAP